MMMKKKFREQEETEQDNYYKPSENKENSLNSENQSGDGSLGESGGYVPDEEQRSDPASDKMVPELIPSEAKLAEMQDKYVRLSAEFDNYRKRTLREKMDMSKYAGENLLLGIIPLMDDFERARQHIDTSSDFGAIKNGIDLIYGKFSDFLKQNGVKEIESLNTNFNVDLHEAVAKVPVEDNSKKGKVIDVVQKGY
jgi:molecular chaperone GrpE